MIRFYTFLLVFNCYLTHVVAQQFPLKNYTIRDGLAGMQVMTLAEDKKGFLWATTKLGISRFDGQKFTYFPKSALNNIPKLQLCSGFIDAEEGIYFTSGRALVFFNGQKFISIPLPKGVVCKLWAKPQRSANGEILVFTENKDAQQSIFAWNYAQKKWSKLIFPTKDTTDVFNPIYYHATTNEWFGYFYDTTRKVATSGFYGLKNGKFTEVFSGKKEAHFEPIIISEEEICVRILEKDKQERYLLKIADKPWIQWLTKKNDADSFSVNQVIDRDLLFKDGGNVYLLEAKSTNPQLVANKLSGVNSYIRAGKTDAFWVATEKGLLFIPNTGFRYFPEEQVPSPWMVVQGADKSFWFGNFGNDLQKFDGKKVTKETRHLSLVGKGNPPTHPSDLKHYYYHGLTDQYGKTWFPEAGNLFVYDAPKKQFELINQFPAYCLLNDPAHNIILQGSHQQVLVIENSPPSATFSLKAGKDLIDYGNFMNLFMDSKQRYWIGGWAGMNRFDSIEALRAKKSKEYSLRKGNSPFSSFITMYEDANKRIWIGAIEGLFYYDERNDSFVSVQDPRLEGVITLLTRFDENSFLIGINEGLYLFNAKEFQRTGKVSLTTYNFHNGFLGLEPGQLGDYHDQEGNIWITSGSVLSYLDPKKLKRNKFPLKPYIQSINEEFILHSASVAVVPKKSNQVFLEVGATGMNRPFATEFSYFIEGISDEWSPWQTSNQLYLGILPNGNHLVKVRTKGENDEHENPSNWAKLTVTVEAYFWKSPNLFKYATFALILLGVIAFLFAKRWQEIQRKLLEKERQMSQLRLTLQQTQITPHFISNALTRLENRLLGGDWEQVGKPFLEKLKILIRKTLELSVQVSENQQPEIPLANELDYLEKYLDFEKDQFSTKQGFTYRIETGNLDVHALSIPPLLVQNYVENAVIHGVRRGELPYPGEIVIQFYTENTTLHCRIEDNGFGSKEPMKTMKIKEQNPHISLGNQLVMARIFYLNQQGYKIKVEKKEKEPNGTIIHLTLQKR